MAGTTPTIGLHPEDVELTKRLRAAGDLLGIQLLDHVIVTDSARVSLRERGLL